MGIKQRIVKLYATVRGWVWNATYGYEPPSMRLARLEDAIERGSVAEANRIISKMNRGGSSKAIADAIKRRNVRLTGSDQSPYLSGAKIGSIRRDS